MNKIILFSAALLISICAQAQYTPVDRGSAIQFTIGNFGIDVHGSFTGVHGNISFDPNDPTADKFDVTIDASTVNTDNTLRDEHLRGSSYFDVKEYPRIHFVSTKVTPGKRGAYLLTGQLTMKGISKEVSFPFTAATVNDGVDLKGSFKINRKDFKVGGTSTIANDLTVSLNIHAIRN